MLIALDECREVGAAVDEGQVPCIVITKGQGANPRWEGRDPFRFWFREGYWCIEEGFRAGFSHFSRDLPRDAL